MRRRRAAGARPGPGWLRGRSSAGCIPAPVTHGRAMPGAGSRGARAQDAPVAGCCRRAGAAALDVPVTGSGGGGGVDTAGVCRPAASPADAGHRRDAAGRPGRDPGRRKAAAKDVSAAG